MMAEREFQRLMSFQSLSLHLIWLQISILRWLSNVKYGERRRLDAIALSPFRLNILPPS